ncbi:TIGR04084 family radical SAM/SPASM domain-containing protein, partial [Acidianus sp. RZ1]|nr:TIGR04084 family radical SAM/SPASM domain-containing protein [Acidianus sp. RZ1]
MLWLVFTTGKCNLICDYCGGSFPKDIVPWNATYNIPKIKSLVENDKDSTVIFYGGEPLANPRFISEFMDRVKANRYGIQTNGTLTKMLGEKYWRKMNVALFSIDGRKEITDKHRGRNIYDTVIKNASYVKSFGVELIARMTVTMDTDIYSDVMHLINLGIFDKIHWQLNVIWTDKWDIKKWANESYLPGIRKLTEFFISKLFDGKIIKIIPILGVINAHYFGPYKGSPCGAGYKSVSITTDGRVLSCPIAVREEWAVLGDINRGFKLMEEPLPEQCRTCDLKRYCGGRCFYASKEKYWGEEGFWEVDEINKQYLKIILSQIPEVDKAIRSGSIS